MKALITVLFLLLAGCATILASDSETIRIDSEPQGQTVAVDGSKYATPALVTLGRDTDHRVTFPNGQTIYVRRTFQPWFLGNILLLSPLGVIIDLWTQPRHGRDREGPLPGPPRLQGRQGLLGFDRHRADGRDEERRAEEADAALQRVALPRAPVPRRAGARLPFVAPPLRCCPASPIRLANRRTGALMSAMTKPRKTHSLRPGEPLALCGAAAWIVRIVPAAVEPSCGTCRRIRKFRSNVRESRRRP